MRKLSRLEKFHDKVERITETGCWIWMGASSGRYGGFYLPEFPLVGRKGMVSAHKSSLFLHKGLVVDSEKDDCVCHTCDVGFCVNPDHLFIGSHAENMHDMVIKKRSIASKRVLTDADIVSARAMRSGGMLVKEIAKFYGIPDSQMSRVTAGCQPKWKINCKGNT